jgi:hypothetical protein
LCSDGIGYGDGAREGAAAAIQPAGPEVREIYVLIDRNPLKNNDLKK